MQLVRIGDLDHPELQPYKTLKRTVEQERLGLIIAEGRHVVERLLDSGLEVISLLMDEAWLEKLRHRLQADRFSETKVFVGPGKVIAGIVGFPLHQNLMAIGRRGPDAGLEGLLEAPPHSLLVALEGITDAENMGMILRNCAAFEVGGLIVGPDSCSPFLRRSIRVSQGTALALRIHRAGNLYDALEELKANFHVRLIGTVPRGGTEDFSELLGEPDRRLCLVFGSEGAGLSTGALKLCEALFSIPMAPEVDSLNVANALAITLYEAVRTLRARRGSEGREPGRH